MKFSTHKNSGFTLLELLVAVTITAIIMVVLLSMTGVVADAWKNGNNKIFTNNEARAGLGRLSTDLENAVFHDIPGAEWFVSTQDESYFSDVPKPANSTWLMFYTIPTDRQIYEKVAGSTEYNYSRPIPGNVVTMSYKIVPQDPISISGSTGKSEFMLYGLYRTSPGNANLAGSNPAKETFDNVLGTSNLKAYWGSNASKSAEKEGFYISNIFDFSFTYWITYDSIEPKIGLVTRNTSPKDEIRVYSERIEWTGPGKPSDFGTPGSIGHVGAKLVAVDISMTILTQQGAQLARANEIPGDDLNAFVANYDNARTYCQKVYFYPEVERVFPISSPAP